MHNSPSNQRELGHLVGFSKVPISIFRCLNTFKNLAPQSLIIVWLSGFGKRGQKTFWEGIGSSERLGIPILVYYSKIVFTYLPSKRQLCICAVTAVHWAVGANVYSMQVCVHRAHQSQITLPNSTCMGHCSYPLALSPSPSYLRMGLPLHLSVSLHWMSRIETLMQRGWRVACGIHICTHIMNKSNTTGK